MGSPVSAPSCDLRAVRMASRKTPLREHITDHILAGARLFIISDRWIVNAKLLKVGVVPRWVKVVLFQLRLEFLHDVLVQPDRRIVLRTEERGVLCVPLLNSFKIICGNN